MIRTTFCCRVADRFEKLPTLPMRFVRNTVLSSVVEFTCSKYCRDIQNIDFPHNKIIFFGGVAARDTRTCYSGFQYQSHLFLIQQPPCFRDSARARASEFYRLCRVPFYLHQTAKKSKVLIQFDCSFCAQLKIGVIKASRHALEKFVCIFAEALPNFPIIFCCA